MIQIDHAIDPRGGFDIFRRKELIEIARQNKIRCEHDAPATFVKLLLMERGIDPLRYTPQRKGPLYGDVGPQRYEYEKDINVEIEQVNLKDMKFNELRRFCKERGIEFSRSDSKQTVLDRLNGKITT